MSQRRTVTLVNAQGSPMGEMDLWEAHRAPATLHRAFSVFLRTPDRRKLLLQQRHHDKPTFGGLWGNTCCSHQFPGETTVAAGERRLMEELGFTVPLTEGPSFVYAAEDPRKNGMAEHEFDTIVVGTADDTVTVTMNPDEVEACAWMSFDELRYELKTHPERYVPWLPIALPLLP